MQESTFFKIIARKEKSEKFLRNASEIGSDTSADITTNPQGLPALGNKMYCFCQNVIVFQNVSRESRCTRDSLGDGMRPVARVGACFFGERANTESMKKTTGEAGHEFRMKELLVDIHVEDT